jgi:hypothetical protein
MTSEIKADKWSPASGTAGTIGDSGDTFTIPSGVTLDTSSSTLTLPSTVVTGQTAITSLADTDKFLVSDASDSGNLKYVEKQYLPSGNLVKIASGSVTGGDGTLGVTGCFTSTYEIYKIFLYNWNASTGNAPYLRWYTGTNTEQSGANTYYYCGVGYNTSGQNSAWSGNDSQFQIVGESFVSDEDAAWEGTLYYPSGTSFKKKLVFAGAGVRSGPYNFNASGTGEWSATTAITGFKVWPSGGTFDSLSYVVYGLVT